MVRLILKLATSILILLSAPAFANIGSITEFKGAGQIKRSAKATPAAKGAKIVKNDTVSTNSQGRFRITFVDSTTVNITENSRLVIDDFVYDGGGKAKGKLGLKVALGTVRYASGKIAHGGGGVNIRSPTATIGVRGTDFVMSVDEIGRTMIVLLPNCFDEKDPTKVQDCPTGAIDVTTPAGTVTLDKPFQATVVESAQTPPATPVVVSLEGKAIGNSLQIAAPKTESGASLVQAARDDVKAQTQPAAAAAESNAEPEVGVEGGTEVTAQVVQENAEEAQVAVQQPEPTQSVYVETTTTIQKSPVVDSSVKTEEPTEEEVKFVKPVYEKTSITYWTVATATKNHEVGMLFSKDTTVSVTVIQDNVTQQYNFAGHNYPNSGFGTPSGYILIKQVSGQ